MTGSISSSPGPGRCLVSPCAIVLGLVFLISGPALATPRRIVSKECVDCHAPVKKEASKKFLHAPFKGEKNCESCHKRHGVVGALVLKEDEPALCLSCHKQQELQMKLMHVHAPLASGKCTSCHNPHASSEAKLLAKPSADLCFTCHGDMREARLGAGHSPFSEGSCGNCHDPHASDRARLLKDQTGPLCKKCHALEIPDLAKARSVHQPVRVGACESCHDPHGSKNPAFLRNEVRLLCLSCHLGLDQRLKLRKAVLHKPVAEGKCLDCHVGHTSAQEALLMKPVQQLCATCHTTADAGFVKAHEDCSIERAECLSCHDPHVSGKTQLGRLSLTY